MLTGCTAKVPMMCLVQLKATVYSHSHPTHASAHTLQTSRVHTSLTLTHSLHTSPCTPHGPASHDHICLCPTFAPTPHLFTSHSTGAYYIPLIYTLPLHSLSLPHSTGLYPTPYFLTSHAPGVQAAAAYAHVQIYVLDLIVMLT